jgi:hypothetical protein
VELGMPYSISSNQTRKNSLQLLLISKVALTKSNCQKLSDGIVGNTGVDDYYLLK